MSGESHQSGKFFDGFADRFDTFYDGKRNPVMRWIDRRFRSDVFTRYTMTFDRLGEMRGRRGLDVGCGSGPYLAEALQRGAAQMVGIDPAPRMLELARQRVQKLGQLDRVKLLEGYFPNIRPDGLFDFAIVMGVLDYVPDAFAFLKALKTCLTGPAAISVPTRHWFRTPIRQVRYRIRRCPLYFYDEALFRSLASRAGFSKLEMIKMPGAGTDYHACLRP